MSALAICHEEREKLRVFKIAQAVFLFQLNSAFSLHLSYESDVSWTGQRLPTILIGETKTARTGGKNHALIISALHPALARSGNSFSRSHHWLPAAASTTQRNRHLHPMGARDQS
jgi:hypothetical protein